jgi:hypothetical protein
MQLSGKKSLLMLVLLLVTQALLQRHLRLRDSAALPFEEAAVLENGGQTLRLPPAVIRAALGGLAPAYIDWNWLRAITDDTLTRLPREFRSRLYQVLDETTDLDPAFFQAYTLGGSLLAIVRDDVHGARLLLEKGIKYMREELPGEPAEVSAKTWSETWRLQMQLGYVYLFELENIPAAEQHFIQAADHPDSPLYVRNLGDRLRQPEGKFIIGNNLLNGMIRSSRDRNDPPSVTRELEQKLQSLHLAHFFFQQNEVLNPSANLGTDSPQEDFQARLKKFKKLIDSGRIPARDPFGSPLRLEPTIEHPRGIITSNTPRQRVFGI